MVRLMVCLQSTWFNTIGVVLVDTGFGLKSYIGNGSGFDQKADENYIMNYGSKFPPSGAIALFGSRYKLEDFAD
jgi:hypothetical protein